MIHHTIDPTGHVLVDGSRVLTNTGAPLRHRATVDVTCQRCGRCVAVPAALERRWEEAIQRDIWWFGVAMEWEELRAVRCVECVERQRRDQ